MPKHFVVFAERFDMARGNIGSMNATKRRSLPSRIPQLQKHSAARLQADPCISII
jgi:hypothetical protein